MAAYEEISTYELSTNSEEINNNRIKKEKANIEDNNVIIVAINSIPKQWLQQGLYFQKLLNKGNNGDDSKSNDNLAIPLEKDLSPLKIYDKTNSINSVSDLKIFFEAMNFYLLPISFISDNEDVVRYLLYSNSSIIKELLHYFKELYTDDVSFENIVMFLLVFDSSNTDSGAFNRICNSCQSDDFLFLTKILLKNYSYRGKIDAMGDVSCYKIQEEQCCSVAAKNGCYETLKYLIEEEHFQYDKNTILIKDDHFECFKYLFKLNKYKWEYTIGPKCYDVLLQYYPIHINMDILKQCVDYACHYNDINYLLKLNDANAIDENNVTTYVEMCCRYNAVECLKFFIQQYKLTPSIEWIDKVVPSYFDDDKLPMLKYMVEVLKLQPTYDSLKNTFEESQYVRYGKYFIEECNVTPEPELLDIVAKHQDSIEALDYLITKHGFQPTEDTCMSAAESSVDCLRYLFHHHGFKPTQEMLKCAVNEENNNVFRYLVTDCKLKPKKTLYKGELRHTLDQMMTDLSILH